MWLSDGKVGLGPFDAALAESYWRWESDPRVRVGYGQQTPESLEERIANVAIQVKNTMHSARFTIYDLSGDVPVPVGTTTLEIDHRQRTAEFFILIGLAENRGRGIGSAATRLTLDYGFYVTNLRCIYLSVLAPNVAGVKAYEKAGFRQIGERRQSGYWAGEPCNEVLMDVVPADFPGVSAVKQLLHDSE
ncbi:GNAT family N-acetyltransferase [Lentzea tibetensis]|uniref:GNAT family N-acetyltransferase n=1 Tax=Lentzea tibetensis TaxID=2591470 RepID=A0A563EF05_9PSEU|nr:GNAT family N-acetyltransferase [Lentzea tibetensis]